MVPRSTSYSSLRRRESVLLSVVNRDARLLLPRGVRHVYSIAAAQPSCRMRPHGCPFAFLESGETLNLQGSSIYFQSRSFRLRGRLRAETPSSAARREGRVLRACARSELPGNTVHASTAHVGCAPVLSCLWSGAQAPVHPTPCAPSDRWSEARLTTAGPCLRAAAGSPGRVSARTAVPEVVPGVPEVDVLRHRDLPFGSAPGCERRQDSRCSGCAWVAARCRILHTSRAKSLVFLAISHI
jgi:hypothetical protein